MGSRWALALATVVSLALSAAGSAQGAITVANQNDGGPGSLRQAIAEAPPGETINVPAGTYTLTSAPLSIGKGLTISGHAPGDTVIRSGGGFRVIEAGGEIDVSIENVTIRDGNMSSDSGVIQGGGIFSLGPDLTLRNVLVTANTLNASASAEESGGLTQGGGIFALSGSLTLIDSSVTGNAAVANGGSKASGGLAQGGGVFALSALTLSNSTISGNLVSVTGGGGPADTNQSGGLAQGSGVFGLTGGSPPVSVFRVTLSGNVADASAGPGGNGGTVQGGGIFLLASNPILLTNTTVVSNTARAPGVTAGSVQGGGLFLSSGGEESSALLSATISDNRIEPTSASGGGGGNLYTNGTITIRNSIVANGAGPPGSENCKVTEEFTSLGFNLESLDQCGFRASGDQVSRDPLLGPLRENGGLTPTMAPAANSPAVDQGAAFGLASDQRGILRPIDLPSIPNSTAPQADGADVGAVEFQPSNELALGKLKKNGKKGTATLAVILPTPSGGALTLEGKGLKKQTKQIAGEGQVKFKVLPKGAVKKALRKKGKRKVQIKVTYAPPGNSAATKSRRAKLVKKKKKRQRKG